MTDDNEDDEAEANIDCVATTRCHASRPVLTSSLCGSSSRQRDVNTGPLCIEDTECVRALTVHAMMIMMMMMMTTIIMTMMTTFAQFLTCSESRLTVDFHKLNCIKTARSFIRILEHILRRSLCIGYRYFDHHF